MAGEVALSPEDVGLLGLRDGDTVQLQSRYGSLVRKIRLDKGLRAGLIFVPTAYDSNSAMDLIGLTELGTPDSPGWNECPVKIEKVG
jgi:formylmethanofuran dehydrogenase subunit D